MSDPNQKPVTQPDRGPHRIKLAHLYARDGSFDMPGGQNQISNLRLGPDSNDELGDRKHYTADYIPAWHVVEVTYLPNGRKGKTEVIILPLHAFKRFVAV